MSDVGRGPVPRRPIHLALEGESPGEPNRGGRPGAVHQEPRPPARNLRRRRSAAWLGLLFLLPLLLLVVGCAAPAAERPGIRLDAVPSPRPVAPQPVVFPRDEAPHDSLSEWWYYTGHLTTESGKRYGFEEVFFQAVRGRNPVGYAAHFAVTDHQKDSFRYEERADTTLRVQGEGEFRLKLGDWEMGGVGDDHYLRASAEGYSIDLRLRSTKPPALHGGIGWVPFGPAGDSYYYSRTRIAVEGTVTVDGISERVTGLAWMDHQWGDFISVNGGGWDWFSLQLDDETEVMVTVLRDQPGNVAATYGTFVDQEGRSVDLKGSELEVRATGSWTSPRTGAEYPSGWVVRLPGQGLEMAVEPVLADQELNTRASTGVDYWEGEVRVAGSRNGAPVAGLGYVELTGYAR